MMEHHNNFLNCADTKYISYLICLFLVSNPSASPKGLEELASSLVKFLSRTMLKDLFMLLAAAGAGSTVEGQGPQF